MMTDETSSDPTMTDILLRHAATEEEMRAIIRVLRHWSNTDPGSFPAQFAAITLTQWYVAAAIPVEMERLLEVYRELVQTGGDRVDALIVARLEEIASTQANFE